VDLGQCLLCALFEGFAYWGTFECCLLSMMGLDGSFVGGVPRALRLREHCAGGEVEGSPHYFLLRCPRYFAFKA